MVEWIGVGGRPYGVDMVCLVCSSSRGMALCGRCRDQLIPAIPRRLDGGLVVYAGLVHAGAARTLVHRLKYQGIRQAAAVLAPYMAGALDGLSGSLIPVPRVPLRVWKYGVDPGWELAGALAALTGMPRKRALRPPLWAARRAGVGREGRTSVRFTAASPIDGRLILVDDVLTTGATLRAARRAAGASPIYGATATSAGRVVM